VSDLLEKLYLHHPVTGRFHDLINRGGAFRCHLRGLPGSSAAMFAASVIGRESHSHLFILNDKEEAAYFCNDLESFCPGREILFFPSSRKRTLQAGQGDPAGIIQRTEVLDILSGDREGVIIVTYPEALNEKILPGSELKKLKLQVNKGEIITREFLVEVLSEYNFIEKDFVYEPGEFAIRGSIVDVFSYSGDRPFRIDFFGNEVESIRVFDIETQLSEGQVSSAAIIPNIQQPANPENMASAASTLLISQLDLKTLIWANDLAVIFSVMDEQAGSSAKAFPGSSRDLLDEMTRFPLVEFGQKAFFRENIAFEFNASPQPVFKKNFELLAENLASNAEKGYTNYIISENEKQFERLRDIFQEIYGRVNFTPVMAGMYKGFIDHDLRITCYTDHQIFERYHRFRLREGFKKKEIVTIKTLHDLKPGDYVVHIDHGIGIFGGLEKIMVNERVQEALKLVYKDGDTLYVSIHSLHRITRYKGKDNMPPKIYKLGSGAWQKLKQKTKDKVKDIARELIALYAKRRMEQGYRFSGDSYLQRELEASFIYEDTPDQLKATGMVKEQMESPVPMDILVCGDVGFGKTEVAIRAAFKAVNDSKQVAVLVPTTILALQHFNTFSERLKDFPCNVEHISRLRSAKKQKEIISRLSAGEIDIVIGTHRIIGKDIRFKDLGLLIIDEEQKFGVSVKEKLKKIRLNIDTLTLTATPIPRTLQFSLMGARDLAVINTPPPNRHPIITELHQFNPDVIRDAVDYEIQRGGQVFFIHNRVKNITEIEVLIQRLCPGAKTIVAHGQMEAARLEKIMLGFISGGFDVLIATTIIESGLDIPNANTIIINNAHHFGLSDLHQLRGRVGRSNKKAFCYLLAPSSEILTREARQRLKAIEEFSDLGSGFNIAMQDLDIRGAGNLLGREQSGFIADIGFDTYHKILDEAVQELRENEFSEVFSGQAGESTANLNFVQDCQVDTDMELLFPEVYIPGNAERIRLYRMLDNIIEEEPLLKFEADLLDRFGTLPEPARELLDIVRLRRIAAPLGFEKIILRNGRMLIYFISNQMSPYYQSPVFPGILNYIQHRKNMKMKEQKHKLTLNVQNVDSVKSALGILREMSSKVLNEGEWT
jgi:transcription-repair coupling factor (superfamily II helicase)